MACCGPIDSRKSISFQITEVKNPMESLLTNHWVTRYFRSARQKRIFIEPDEP
ncbi:unnamed protein product [Brassica rapa subsp. trilocularis]